MTLRLLQAAFCSLGSVELTPTEKLKTSIACSLDVDGPSIPSRVRKALTAANADVIDVAAQMANTTTNLLPFTATDGRVANIFCCLPLSASGMPAQRAYCAVFTIECNKDKPCRFVVFRQDQFARE